MAIEAHRHRGRQANTGEENGTVVAKLDCTVVAKIDGKDPLYVISRLPEMLLDPEEPYAVAVHNGEHETFRGKSEL